jgi:hypothetical protein
MKQNTNKSWLEQLVKNYQIPKEELGTNSMLTEEQRRIIKQSKK